MNQHHIGLNSWNASHDLLTYTQEEWLCALLDLVIIVKMVVWLLGYKSNLLGIRTIGKI